MTTPTINTATASDMASVIDVLVLAFSTDPVVRWMYPDPHQFLINFPLFVRAFGGKAFAEESSYHVDEYAGAALWLPPGIHPDEDVLFPLLRRTLAERERADAFSVFEQMAGYHPDGPHWYLPLIGVDPTRQRKGYGTALMRHALIPCDRDQIPAYLESSNPDNIPLYQQHGFELLGTIQAGASPPLFPMLRQPQSQVLKFSMS